MKRSSRLHPWLFGLLLLLGASSGVAQQAPDTWQLTVCADQDNLPYSNAKQEGFENQILTQVAAAIGATIDYVWLPRIRNNSQDILLLRDGTCDVFLDIGNGQAPYLPTLDYYQSTYVFFYKKDAGFTVASVDDPGLRDLRIGTAAASPAGTALALRDLIGNLRDYFPVPPTGVTEAIVRDVASGALDVGAAWGPEVAYFARQLGADLELVPIEPQIDVNGLSMVYTAAMGVRTGDLDLRDALNAGLASSWTAVQRILDDFAVPQLPLPTPSLSIAEASQSATLTLGVVLPMLTGGEPLGAFTSDVVGSLAAMGATLAAEELAGLVAASGRQLKVLISSAPDLASTLRAAHRMVHAEQVSALVGGFDDASVQALAELATQEGVLFMNVGAQGDELRSQACSPLVFHVEASSAMYIDAALLRFVATGHSRWYVVGSDDATQRARQARATTALHSQGASIVGTSVVAPGQPNYVPALVAASQSQPDALLLLLEAPAQLTLLGQYAPPGLGADVILYPNGASQTRQFYANALYYSPDAVSGDMIALWEATIAQGAAGHLNGRFLQRFGQGMDPPAWATYVALKLLVEAAIETGSEEAAAWSVYLLDPATEIDVLKGPGTSFRQWDHQLRQPLYAVALNPEFTDKKAFRDIATVVAELPEVGDGSSAATALDRLGAEPRAAGCTVGGGAAH